MEATGYIVSEDNLIVKLKKPAGDDGYKTFSVRIRKDIVNRIDAIAKQTGRSRNELISMFMEYALDRCVIKEDGCGPDNSSNSN